MRFGVFEGARLISEGQKEHPVSKLNSRKLKTRGFGNLCELSRRLYSQTPGIAGKDLRFYVDFLLRSVGENEHFSPIFLRPLGIVPNVITRPAKQVSPATLFVTSQFWDLADRNHWQRASISSPCRVVPLEASMSETSIWSGEPPVFVIFPPASVTSNAPPATSQG